MTKRLETALIRQLDEIWRFWNSAHAELLPGNGGAGSRSGERTIGVNVQALSFIAGDDILGTLHEWERLIRFQRELTPPAMLPKLPLADEIKAAVQFAVVMVPWIVQQDWAEDFAAEINELHHLGKTAARNFSNPDKRISCPADIAENQRCDQSLKINEQNLDEIVICRNCKTHWTTARLMAVALSDSGNSVWLDVEAISSYLNISEKSVYQIIKKHQVQRRGQLYSFKEILAIRKAI